MVGTSIAPEQIKISENSELHGESLWSFPSSIFTYQNMVYQNIKILSFPTLGEIFLNFYFCNVFILPRFYPDTLHHKHNVFC